MDHRVAAAEPVDVNPVRHLEQLGMLCEISTMGMPRALKFIVLPRIDTK